MYKKLRNYIVVFGLLVCVSFTIVEKKGYAAPFLRVDFRGSVTSAAGVNFLALSAGDTVTGFLEYDSMAVQGVGLETVSLGVPGRPEILDGWQLVFNMGETEYQDSDVFFDIRPSDEVEVTFENGEIVGFNYGVYDHASFSDFFIVNGLGWQYESDPSGPVSGDWNFFSAPKIVPEPGTIALFGVGIFGTLLYTRKRRKNAA